MMIDMNVFQHSITENTLELDNNENNHIQPIREISKRASG